MGKSRKITYKCQVSDTRTSTQPVSIIKRHKVSKIDSSLQYQDPTRRLLERSDEQYRHLGPVRGCQERHFCSRRLSNIQNSEDSEQSFAKARHSHAQLKLIHFFLPNTTTNWKREPESPPLYISYNQLPHRTFVLT